MRVRGLVFSRGSGEREGLAHGHAARMVRGGGVVVRGWRGVMRMWDLVVRGW